MFVKDILNAKTGQCYKQSRGLTFGKSKITFEGKEL